MERSAELSFQMASRRAKHGSCNVLPAEAGGLTPAKVRCSHLRCLSFQISVLQRSQEEHNCES